MLACTAHLLPLSVAACQLRRLPSHICPAGSCQTGKHRAYDRQCYQSPSRGSCRPPCCSDSWAAAKSPPAALPATVDPSTDCTAAAVLPAATPELRKPSNLRIRTRPPLYSPRPTTVPTSMALSDSHNIRSICSLLLKVKKFCSIEVVGTS